MADTDAHRHNIADYLDLVGAGTASVTPCDAMLVPEAESVTVLINGLAVGRLSEEHANAFKPLLLDWIKQFGGDNAIGVRAEIKRTGPGFDVSVFVSLADVPT